MLWLQRISLNFNNILQSQKEVAQTKQRKHTYTRKDTTFGENAMSWTCKLVGSYANRHATCIVPNTKESQTRFHSKHALPTVSQNLQRRTYDWCH